MGDGEKREGSCCHFAVDLGAARTRGCRAIRAAQTDQYPSRPITIIVPFLPGGSSDVVTRLVGTKFADNLKANVVIDNRGGGGGVRRRLRANK
jgi:tripartite-type tricarboxylate transporter receptor subunit TctC